MYAFLLIIHVLISIVLILIILAQSSKGGALDGLVGGTASSMFGSHGASAFLGKWTKIIGAIWMISSLILAMNIRAMHRPARARALERIRAEAPASEVPATDYEALDLDEREAEAGDIRTQEGVEKIEIPPAEAKPIETIPAE